MALPFITFCLAHSEEHIIYTWRLNMHLFVTSKDKMINITSENQREFTREMSNPKLQSHN